MRGQRRGDGVRVLHSAWRGAGASPAGVRTPIARLNFTRLLLVAAMALVLGLGGGVVGGLTATRLLGDSTGTGRSSATPTAAATPANPATASPDFTDQVRAAVDRVLPAIVTVRVILPERVDATGATVQSTNVGSGIVISDRGHVLTNFHVVEGAATLSVVLATGEERPAQFVSDDSPFTDMAVLQVAPAGLRVASFGSSDALRAGDTVLAVRGGAITPGNSVAIGVVSGTGRVWARNNALLEDLVQTDAAINSGDSGGALVNLDGEVVGLLTTVVREGPGGVQIHGVTFAQSSDSLRSGVEDIVARGFHPRARLGIERVSQHAEITPEVARAQGFPVPAGAFVRSVASGSPAAQVGIEPGDIVVGVNGVAVDLENPLVNLLKRLDAGASAELAVIRGNEQLTFDLAPNYSDVPW